RSPDRHSGQPDRSRADPLDLAGLPPDPEHRGRDLAPALRDGSEPPPAPVWAESPEYGPDRFALREGDLKVVVTPYPKSSNAGVSLPVKPLEVFDLATDPKEQADLSGRLSDPARRMMVELWERCRRFLATLGEDRGKAEIPKELEEQL